MVRSQAQIIENIDSGKIEFDPQLMKVKLDLPQ